MPRWRKIRIIPEFKTDPNSLRGYLSAQADDAPEPEEATPPEYEEETTGFGVIIREHLLTGARYLESEDLKIWIFRKDSRRPVIRMVADEGMTFMRRSESEIPEEQRKLFGYEEYVSLFSESKDTAEYNPFSQKVMAVVYLCLAHWIPSGHVSEMVDILPKPLYKIARRIGGTFDYAEKYHSEGARRGKNQSIEEFRREMEAVMERKRAKWEAWRKNKWKNRKPYDF